MKKLLITLAIASIVNAPVYAAKKEVLNQTCNIAACMMLGWFCC